MKARVLHPDEIDQLHELVSEWRSESPMPDEVLDTGTLSNRLKRLAGSQRGPAAYTTAVIGLTADDTPNEIIGFMGLIVVPRPMGPGVDAHEHLWYIHPLSRGIGFRTMLEKAQQWAASEGCQRLCLTASALASLSWQRVAALYERLGFTLYEQSYYCEV